MTLLVPSGGACPFDLYIVRAFSFYRGYFQHESSLRIRRRL